MIKSEKLLRRLQHLQLSRVMRRWSCRMAGLSSAHTAARSSCTPCTRLSNSRSWILSRLWHLRAGSLGAAQMEAAQVAHAKSMADAEDLKAMAAELSDAAAHADAHL